MANIDTPAAEGKKTTPPTEEKKVLVEKPEKPDEDAYKSAEKSKKKEYDDAKAKFDAANQKYNNAHGGKDTDTPEGKRKQELFAQLKEIKEQQSNGKAGRNKVQEEIVRLDTKLRSLIEEQKTARSKLPYRNVAELDNRVKELETSVEKDRLTMVQEKKALADVTSLRKQRKSYAGLDTLDTQITEIKKKIAELKTGLHSAESKALSEKYDKIQGELNELKEGQDQAKKSIGTLRAEKDAAHKVSQEKYLALKKVRDDFYQGMRAFKDYEYKARQKNKERRAAEQEAYEKEKKKERAQKLLDEASDKAYLDEIRRAESLLRFLDPSYTKETAPLKAPSQFILQAGRTIEEAAIKGMKAIKKTDEEDYFKGTGGKKGKKGRKAAAGTGDDSPPATGKYSCPPAVMEDCSSMGIEPPMTAEDIPGVREKVKAKMDFWKNDQDAQTQKNIAKARKEVERLDAEDAGAASVTHLNGHGHGETKATASVDEGGSVANEIALEDAAVADAAADLKEATIEDAIAV